MTTCLVNYSYIVYLLLEYLYNNFYEAIFTSLCFLVDNTSELLVSLSSGNLEDFYPSAAIASLMKILKDPSLSQHHTMVIQVLDHNVTE